MHRQVNHARNIVKIVNKQNAPAQFLNFENFTQMVELQDIKEREKNNDQSSHSTDVSTNLSLEENTLKEYGWKTMHHRQKMTNPTPKTQKVRHNCHVHKRGLPPRKRRSASTTNK